MTKPTNNPNIFNYATSELSQDAFICYMLNFPDAAKLFLDKCGIYDEEIKDIRRQYLHIDVLVETDNHYLIIEDKTGTGEHDDQICRYVEELSKNHPNGIKPIHVCYLKTYDYLWDYEPPQNNKAALVVKKNCFSLNREHILGILNDVQCDEILSQFKEYLTSFEVDIEHTRIARWTQKHWFKFLAPFIKKKKEDDPNLWADIGYVSNRSGGFYGCWFGGDEETFPNYVLYKQIEIECTENGSTEIRLCYKVQTKQPKNISEERPKIQKGILDQIKNRFKQKNSDFKLTGRCTGWSTTYAKKEFTQNAKEGKSIITEEEIKDAIKLFISSNLF